jgi:hypothetical protein
VPYRSLALALVCVVGAFGLAAPPAHADVLTPNEAACRGSSAGAPCLLGPEPGACVPGTCYRNDYSAGPPPRSVPVACLTCEAGAAPSIGGLARSWLLVLVLPIVLGVAATFALRRRRARSRSR